MNTNKKNSYNPLFKMLITGGMLVMGSLFVISCVEVDLSQSIDATKVKGEELRDPSASPENVASYKAELASSFELREILNPPRIRGLPDPYAWFRVGDLTGDGKFDYVFTRGTLSQVAYTQSGEVIWKYSNPDGFPTTCTSAPCLIYDFDGDGMNEVITHRSRQEGGEQVIYLCIIDGRTGEIKKERPWPRIRERGMNNRPPRPDIRAHLAIARLDGPSKPPSLVIRNGYRNVIVLNNELEIMWENTRSSDIWFGHDPLIADITGDGFDDILCGTVLFKRDGTVLWAKPPAIEQTMEERSAHNDSPWVADIDGNPDNGVEIFLSTGAALWSSKGEPIWELGEQIVHGQKAFVANIRPDLPGKEIVLLDQRRKGGEEQDVVLLIGSDGSILHTWPGYAVHVGDWSGDGVSEVFIGQELSPQTYEIIVSDGHGNVMTVIPRRMGMAFGASMVVDVLGDGRVELLTAENLTHRLPHFEIWTNVSPNPHEATNEIINHRDSNLDRNIYNYRVY